MYIFKKIVVRPNIMKLQNSTLKVMTLLPADNNNDCLEVEGGPGTHVCRSEGALLW